MIRHPVVVVQGGQWGSEAKGAIAAHLCVRRNIGFVVRTGSINAGHSVEFGGKIYAMQQLPTGWINPSTNLVIGAGAYIHLPTLLREVDMVNAAMPERDVRDRIYIDIRCGTHTEEAEGLSKLANRHHLMGATGKGCSEAIVAKIRNRNAGYQLFADLPESQTFQLVDTVSMLNRAIDNGEKVLIEGTQGTLLDLHLGPYPFTTSRMTSAANWIAEAGLSPSLEYEVVLVVRTYPIRVAGNSGPMSGEMEWTDLARSINGKLQASAGYNLVDPAALHEFEQAMQRAANVAPYPVPQYRHTLGHKFDTVLSKWTPAMRQEYRVAASELHRDALTLCSAETVAELRKLFEMTTVTKKLRRVAALNVENLRYAIMINRPSWIALTFLDYVEPELAGVRASDIERGNVIDAVYATGMRAIERADGYIHSLENKLGIRIHLVSTGPHDGCIFSATSLEVRQSAR